MSIVASSSAAPVRRPRPADASPSPRPSRPPLRVVPPPAPPLRVVPPPAPPPRLRPATLVRGAAALCCGLAVGFALAGAVQQPFGHGHTHLAVALVAALVAAAAQLAARTLDRARPSRR
jgi:hypothetical protein